MELINVPIPDDVLRDDADRGDAVKLRDYFAASVLQGLANNIGLRGVSPCPIAGLVAALAYELADAKLAARKVRST